MKDIDPDDCEAMTERAIENADQLRHAMKEGTVDTFELQGPKMPADGRVLMQCGHVAQGFRTLPDGTRMPACIICACISKDPLAPYTPAPDPPDLTGRTAYCADCKKPTPSAYTLPFFELGRWVKGERKEDEDTYYCGCRGWD